MIFGGQLVYVQEVTVDSWSAPRNRATGSRTNSVLLRTLDIQSWRSSVLFRISAVLFRISSVLLRISDILSWIFFVLGRIYAVLLRLLEIRSRALSILLRVFSVLDLRPLIINAPQATDSCLQGDRHLYFGT